jgi:hypothetical protein
MLFKLAQEQCFIKIWTDINSQNSETDSLLLCVESDYLVKSTYKPRAWLSAHHDETFLDPKSQYFLI